MMRLLCDHGKFYMLKKYTVILEVQTLRENFQLKNYSCRKTLL